MGRDCRFDFTLIWPALIARATFDTNMAVVCVTSILPLQYNLYVPDILHELTDSKYT